MFIVNFTTKFKKDYKLAVKRGYDMELFEYVVNELANQWQLPEKFRDHELVGKYSGLRECHIQPDWLLIYMISQRRIDLDPFSPRIAFRPLENAKKERIKNLSFFTSSLKLHCKWIKDRHLAQILSYNKKNEQSFVLLIKSFFNYISSKIFWLFEKER